MICYNSNNLIVWEINETEEELIFLIENPNPEISKDTNKSHRLQSLAASIIVKDCLHDEICHQENGRPYLKSSKKNISISNTGKYVAVIFGEGRVGVDIELVTRNASRIIDRVSEKKEQKLANTIFPENSAIFLWCLKETAYKMIKDQPEGMALGQQHLVAVDTQKLKAVMETKEGIFQLSFFVIGSLLVVWGSEDYLFDCT